MPTVTAKRVKKPKLINKTMWSEALHTALRKACDSTPSSIAWNLICVLEGDAWAKYCEFIEKLVPELYKTLPLDEALKQASKKWDCYAYSGDTRHITIALHCTFELFEDSDWEGFASFLVPYGS